MAIIGDRSLPSPARKLCVIPRMRVPILWVERLSDHATVVVLRRTKERSDHGSAKLQGLIVKTSKLRIPEIGNLLLFQVGQN